MEIPSIAQPLIVMLIVGAVSWMLMQRNGRFQWQSRREAQNLARDLSKKRTEWIARPPVSGISMLEAPPEINRWQVELHDQMRDWQAELDSKAHVLQSLLRVCSEESSRLEQMLSQVQASGKSLAVAASADDPCETMDQPSSPLINRQLANAVYRLSDLGKECELIARELQLTASDVELILNLRSPR